MTDKLAYEATIVSREKLTKEKRDGGTYDVVELTYKSNNKEFKTSVLLSAKDLVEKLKALKKGEEKTLVFEKKGKFNQLVDVEEKGSSSKYRASGTSNYSGKSYSKAPYDSSGLERGNALHCASRCVAALLYNKELPESHNPVVIAELINLIADSIQASRSKQPEKKKDNDFEEIETIDDEPPFKGAHTKVNDSFDESDFNDSIDF